jgi:SAM-dependent methyltransferase
VVGVRKGRIFLLRVTTCCCLSMASSRDSWARIRPDGCYSNKHNFSGDRMLDIGCGTGTFAVLPKQSFPAVEVVGLDPDRKELARARRKTGLGYRFDSMRDLGTHLITRPAASM